MFSLKFRTGNDNFFGDDKPFEIARILREIAGKVEKGYKDGIVQDLNGNTIGKWKA